MATWWLVSVNFAAPYPVETTNPTSIAGLTGEAGPFPTRAAAIKAIPGSGLGSGGTNSNPNPGGGGKWWVEYIVVPGGDLATPRYVESATEPKVAGEVQHVSGPYPSKAAAEAAATGGTAGGGGTGVHLPSVGGTVKGALGGLLPTFQNTRGLVVRIAQVTIGIILIITGLVQISRVSQLVPAAVKGLAIA